MFTIDPRSLAAFRMGFAVILLWDLYGRAVDLAPFYTDDGLVPRIMQLDMLDHGDPRGLQHEWSLHMLNGELWSQAILLGVAATFAVWLLVGYRTQLAAFASWLLLLSLDNRNPMVLDAGDSILRAMLFWSLFLPLGMRWSVDRRLTMPGAAEPPPLCSMFTAALMLQLAMMYLASVGFKWHSVWIREFSAVYYVLNGDTLPRVGALAARIPVRHALAHGGHGRVRDGRADPGLFALEECVCRCLVIGAFTLFHLGLAITLTLCLFPWICIASWLLFTPAPVWDWLERQGFVRRAIGGSWSVAQNQAAQIRAWIPAPWRVEWFTRPEQPQVRSAWWRQALVALLFLYIVVWNVREVMGPAWIDRIMPYRYNGPALALGLAQGWTMYAPIPRTLDGWLVMKGTLRDGTEVNLWAPGQPLPWAKPALVSAMFPTSRWRRYLDSVAVDNYAYHRQFLADWLQRRWDREQSGGVEAKQVAKVELDSTVRSHSPTRRSDSRSRARRTVRAALLGISPTTTGLRRASHAWSFGGPDEPSLVRPSRGTCRRGPVAAPSALLHRSG